MKKGHELIKPVLDTFPGLPERLSNLFGKGKTWWYSHGYELRKDNPLANGNLSAVDHVLKMCDQYEAAMPGAGKALAENLIAELHSRFRADYPEMTDREIRRNLNHEFFEAIDKLDESDLDSKTVLELGALEAELGDIRRVVDDTISIIRAKKRRKEIGAATREKFSTNGKH